MKETVWIHLPREYKYKLGAWSEYFCYDTEDNEWGKLLAYRFVTSRTEYSNFLSFLNENKIKYFIFRRDYSFTQKEKDEAEILELIIDGNADDSESPEQLFYKCEDCNNKVRKLNREHVHVGYKFIKKYDLSESYLPNSEIFISERLRDIFLNEEVQSVEFKPIFQIGKSNKLIELFYQLHLMVGIGSVVEPTIIESGTQCTACEFNTKFLMKGLLYFKRSEWLGMDICYTHDWFGDIYESTYCGGKAIIITQKLYRILKENTIKLFSVRPAYFID